MLMAKTLMGKGYRARSAKGQVHGVKSGEAWQSPFPVKSHRVRSVPPAMSGDAWEMLPTMEAR